MAWSLAALAAIALAAVLLHAPGNQTAVGVDVLSILPPDQTALGRGDAPQISPDGRIVAFAATDRAGRTGLYVRSRDSLTARLLLGTVDATMPFWSPDSRPVGFFAQGQLKIIALTGGPPHAIVPFRRAAQRHLEP